MRIAPELVGRVVELEGSQHLVVRTEEQGGRYYVVTCPADTHSPFCRRELVSIIDTLSHPLYRKKQP